MKATLQNMTKEAAPTRTATRLSLGSWSALGLCLGGLDTIGVLPAPHAGTVASPYPAIRSSFDRFENQSQEGSP